LRKLLSKPIELELSPNAIRQEEDRGRARLFYELLDEPTLADPTPSL
jgi:hypothetical protein